jgi:hypothetical protein
MTMTAERPTSTEVLRSLRLLRSDDPEDRQRGIQGLSDVRDDPRVAQVFEHLYQEDPDPRVRAAAWSALNGAAASVPSPAPKPSPTAPEKALPRRLFLLNTDSKSLVTQESRRSATLKNRQRALKWLATLLAILAGALAVSAAFVSNTPKDSLALAACGVVALAALALLARRDRAGQARLLRGQVIACAGLRDGDGDFILTLRYRFRDPSGAVITDQLTEIRNDLKDAPLPLPGAPLAVYYRDAQTHRLL